MTTATVWLEVSEVAEQLRVSEWFVRQEITRNALCATKVGRVWRLSQADVDRYMQAGYNVRPKP